MAIIRVGANSAEATTVTIPTGHIIGDIMIIFAFRDGSTTNPTVPAGWTTITNTTDGTLCSVSMGYKVALSTAETSGTWSNATELVCIVYRGWLNLTGATPFGTIAVNAGTLNSGFNYAARTLAASGVTGSSWFIAFAGHRSTNTALETPPSGMALASSIAGATAEAAGFDTNGIATANWPSTNVTIGGTDSGWQTVVLELKANGNQINNFAFARDTNTGDTGILSFTEKIK